MGCEKGQASLRGTKSGGAAADGMVDGVVGMRGRAQRGVPVLR